MDFLNNSKSDLYFKTTRGDNTKDIYEENRIEKDSLNQKMKILNSGVFIKVPSKLRHNIFKTSCNNPVI